MINKIKTIKNLGIFENYAANNDIQKFSKFNLIYGWNGSGKTTLSRLFEAFESGRLRGFPDLRYTINCNEGDFSIDTPYNKKIRVFNQEYIINNVDMVLGDIKPIFILGEVNLNLSKAIQKDEEELDSRTKNLVKKQTNLEQKTKNKNQIFTNTARIISANTSGVSARNYNKRNAENAFNALSAKQILSDERKQEHLTTLKQQEKFLSSLVESIEASQLTEIVNDAKNVLNQTVETIVIDRLKDNPSISKWVEEGIDLHKENNSNSCEFCNQSLPIDRLPRLLSYFNDADKLLKNDIDFLLERAKEICILIDNLVIIDKTNLYDEFQENYELESNSLKMHKDELLKQVDKLREELKHKKQHTTEILELQVQVDGDLFLSSLNEINLFIEHSNQKTIDFTSAKNTAKQELERHYLSEVFDEVKDLESSINVLGNEMNKITEGEDSHYDGLSLKAIRNRVAENKNTISSSGAACEEINQQLTTFLGRNELVFEVAGSGYEIKRNGKPANRLSEGEKTAIAFVYFIIHLKDQDFDIQNGIVVIDDPISSMDSNSIFQAFSFLKNAVKDAEQIFILTHNFEFLKLVLGWMKRNKHGYFMIKNPYNGTQRMALLDELDPLLEKYDTEYQYLFKLLVDFEADDIESAYCIPNIARKTLESFLLFMVPNSDNLFQKLEKIEFDENKKTAIYKFTNSQSHKTGRGFDPSLVPECKKNVKYLLEMIETTFPQHYLILTEL